MKQIKVHAQQDCSHRTLHSAHMAHTVKHARTHTHTHTCTRAHAHTRTYTHTTHRMPGGWAAAASVAAQMPRLGGRGFGSGRKDRRRVVPLLLRVQAAAKAEQVVAKMCAGGRKGRAGGRKHVCRWPKKQSRWSQSRGRVVCPSCCMCRCVHEHGPGSSLSSARMHAHWTGQAVAACAMHMQAHEHGQAQGGEQWRMRAHRGSTRVALRSRSPACGPSNRHKPTRVRPAPCACYMHTAGTACAIKMSGTMHAAARNSPSHTHTLARTQSNAHTHMLQQLH